MEQKRFLMAMGMRQDEAFTDFISRHSRMVSEFKSFNRAKLLWENRTLEAEVLYWKRLALRLRKEKAKRRMQPLWELLRLYQNPSAFQTILRPTTKSLDPRGKVCRR